jgi:hypothetical protein
MSGKEIAARRIRAIADGLNQILKHRCPNRRTGLRCVTVRTKGFVFAVDCALPF